MRKNLVQKSDEWLLYRSSKIGASDAAAIMGESPWKTARDLYEEKKGIKIVKVNKAMQHGNINEDFARADFESRMMVKVQPAVYENDQASWMIASLDGISDDESVAVEIKCPMSLNSHLMAVAGEVPKHYWIQMQHQMAVVSLQKMYYCSFYQDESEIIEVKRSDAYIDRLIEAERKFYQCLINDTPPEPTSKDCEVIATTSFFEVSERYKDVLSMISALEDEKANLRDELLRIAGERNIKGNGLQIKKSIRKGAINYKLVPEELASKLDTFRAKDSEIWRISLVA